MACLVLLALACGMDGAQAQKKGAKSAAAPKTAQQPASLEAINEKAAAQATADRSVHTLFLLLDARSEAALAAVEQLPRMGVKLEQKTKRMYIVTGEDADVLKRLPAAYPELLLFTPAEMAAIAAVAEEEPELMKSGFAEKFSQR